MLQRTGLPLLVTMLPALTGTGLPTSARALESFVGASNWHLSSHERLVLIETGIQLGEDSKELSIIQQCSQPYATWMQRSIISNLTNRSVKDLTKALQYRITDFENYRLREQLILTRLGRHDTPQGHHARYLANIESRQTILPSDMAGIGSQFFWQQIPLSHMNFQGIGTDQQEQRIKSAVAAAITLTDRFSNLEKTYPESATLLKKVRFAGYSETALTRLQTVLDEREEFSLDEKTYPPQTIAVATQKNVLQAFADNQNFRNVLANSSTAEMVILGRWLKTLSDNDAQAATVVFAKSSSAAIAAIRNIAVFQFSPHYESPWSKQRKGLSSLARFENSIFPELTTLMESGKVTTNPKIDPRTLIRQALVPHDAWPKNVSVYTSTGDVLTYDLFAPKIAGPIKNKSYDFKLADTFSQTYGQSGDAKNKMHPSGIHRLNLNLTGTLTHYYLSAGAILKIRMSITVLSLKLIHLKKLLKKMRVSRLK